MEEKGKSSHLQEYNERKRKRIVAIRLSDGEGFGFSSVAEGARQLSLKPENISMVLHGRRSSTGGYTFLFEQEEGENKKWQ